MIDCCLLLKVRKKEKKLIGFFFFLTTRQRFISYPFNYEYSVMCECVNKLAETDCILSLVPVSSQFVVFCLGYKCERREREREHETLLLLRRSRFSHTRRICHNVWFIL